MMQVIDVTENCHECGAEIEMQAITQKCPECSAENVACHGCTHWENEDIEPCGDCTQGSNFKGIEA